MFKVLSGSLSAIFNLDGLHLSRYLAREKIIVKSIFEELILHEQILIPTQDYLTACGLILLLGEQNFISLLELDRIRFLRLRGCFGYIRGEKNDGTIITFNDPKKMRPQSSSIEESIEAGLSTISDKISEINKLKKLFQKQSEALEMSEIIDTIKRDSFNDLKKTTQWKEEYNFSDKDLLFALPGVENMQVRILGPGTDTQNNIIDTLLTLTLFNIELYLASKFACSSAETGSPLGNLIELKTNRLLNQDNLTANMWTLFEINNIPDISKINYLDKKVFNYFLKISENSNAVEFRKWFHEKKNYDEKEILKQYVELLKSIPNIQSVPSKILRFVITSGLGTIPPIGMVASFLDSFVVEKVFKGKSPKFFVEDMAKFIEKIN